MTLNEEITIIEDALKSILVKSSLGVKKVYIGDVNASLQFPSVQLINKGADKSDVQTINGIVVGLVLRFDVNCLFSGSESEQTIKQAQKFTNDVYDLIQKESLSNYRLNGTCLNLDCTSIEHGTLNYDNVFIYGGLITLDVEILHTIGE
jgi:hypothetical protein